MTKPARHTAPNAPRRLRTLLFGAGEAGATIARSAVREPLAGVEPVGFLDDDRSRKGQHVAGLPVYGGMEAMADAIALTGAEALLITMPAAAGAAIRYVTEAGLAAGLAVRTVPAIHELFDGSVDAFRVRRVRVEDLIRRPEVSRLGDAVEGIIRDRVVLVTGAGGSIGSELARQVFSLGPRRLLLVDRGESALYSIQRELEARLGGAHAGPEVSVHLSNVASRALMNRLIEQSRPDVILHAAAYKHVPLMEAHPSEAVQVNIGGTMALLDAAVAAGTPTFVLVSTDKAVVPTSAMGATKRLAEWLVAEAARWTGRAYVSVRFGNVLGSTGSVVPIFQSQLEQGQPLTITHPEMTRYFMTIAEASTLILEAAALGVPSDVFVLDMGEPIRIVDLARDFVRLAGRDPDTVPIVFTGLRPGEKLHEQLFYDHEVAQPTANPQVMLARGSEAPEEIRRLVLELLDLADGRDEVVLRQRLSAIVGSRTPLVSASAASPAPESTPSGRASPPTVTARASSRSVRWDTPPDHRSGRRNTRCVCGGTASAHRNRTTHEGPPTPRIGIVERAAPERPSNEYVASLAWRASGHEIMALAVGIAGVRGERQRPGVPVTWRIKRLMDVVIAASALFLLAPVLGLTAIAVLVSMGRPIFFRQMRPGYRGHPFELVKFRSMRTEGNSARPEVPEHYRLTKLGYFLRRTSIDELPELWNIVKGDMSLVGPRPLLMRYLPRYTAEQARRHDVRPGLTGLAQVSGRQLLDWDQRFKLDVWYADNWSLRLDLRILASTLTQVIGGRGLRPGGALDSEFIGSTGKDRSAP